MIGIRSFLWKWHNTVISSTVIYAPMQAGQPETKKHSKLHRIKNKCLIIICTVMWLKPRTFCYFILRPIVYYAIQCFNTLISMNKSVIITGEHIFFLKIRPSLQQRTIFCWLKFAQSPKNNVFPVKTCITHYWVEN